MKKKTFILIISVALAVLIGTATFLIINNTTSNPKTKGASLIYYVDEGLEKDSAPIKKAVEAYLNQNAAEKDDGRIIRLKEYFTSDSPAYNYGMVYITDSIEKTKATVTSIKFNDSEGLDPSVDVAVKLELNSDSNKTATVYKTLWITYRGSGDKLLIYDIGEY